MPAAFPKGLRVLLVGDYMWPWYQETCAQALEQLGCVVERFGWFDDFRRWAAGDPVYLSLAHRIQYRVMSGPVVWRVNRRLVRVSQEFRPDIVWFYNVQLISPSTIKKLRLLLPRTVFCQYANDNPFSDTAKRGFWRHLLAAIPHFDIHFSYRESNIADYVSHGATSAQLLRSYFIPEVDYPEPAESIPERFRCDVVFAGHYEDDGRVEMLEAVCRSGLDFRLYGGGWNAALPRLAADSPLRKKFPVAPAVGADYRYAICGAKVALCFLSTLNDDTYTRRSFQIPAMKTAMLSQYTDDLAALFQPDVEAAYFSDAGELVEKLKTLIADDALRSSMAEAGYRRVYQGGHDVGSRMRFFLARTIKWREENVINSR